MRVRFRPWPFLLLCFFLLLLRLILSKQLGATTMAVDRMEGLIISLSDVKNALTARTNEPLHCAGISVCNLWCYDRYNFYGSHRQAGCCFTGFRFLFPSHGEPHFLLFAHSVRGYIAHLTIQSCFGGFQSKRNFQGYSVKSLARERMHTSRSANPLVQRISSTLCCTVEHTRTGARQRARTPGERRPQRLCLRGYNGKSAR